MKLEEHTHLLLILEADISELGDYGNSYFSLYVCVYIYILLSTRFTSFLIL